MLEAPASGQLVARPPPSHPAGLPGAHSRMSSLPTTETWNSGFLQLPHSNAHSLGRPSANLSAQRGEHEGE